MQSNPIQSDQMKSRSGLRELEEGLQRVLVGRTDKAQGSKIGGVVAQKWSGLDQLRSWGSLVTEWMARGELNLRRSWYVPMQGGRNIAGGCLQKPLREKKKKKRERGSEGE